MHFQEDPRVKVGRRCLVLAWIYFFLYLGTILLTSYRLGMRPYLWGLPRWVAIGNIIVPVVFVVLLIFVVEAFIPDVSLTDDTDKSEDEE